MSFFIPLLIWSFADFDCYSLCMPTINSQSDWLHSLSHASHTEDNSLHTDNSKVIDILAIIYK